MSHPNALLEKLASSSLRSNKSLIVLGALVLLLLGISYVGVQRMVEEQRDTISFHFTRLMENIHEQETFLSNIALKSKRDNFDFHATLPLFQLKPAPDKGPDFYEGREFSFSLPFSVRINPDTIAARRHANIFALGTYLSNYYGAFWSASHYQAPQVILFKLPDNFSIVVPASGQLRGDGQIQAGRLAEVIKQLTQRLQEPNAQPLNNPVHWARYRPLAGEDTSPILLAFINVELSKPRPGIQDTEPSMVVTTLLNLSQINHIERLMQWSIYDDFTLITPGGVVLTGAVKPGQALQEGVNFNRDGLVFKLTSQGEHHWTAIYVNPRALSSARMS